MSDPQNAGAWLAGLRRKIKRDSNHINASINNDTAMKQALELIRQGKLEDAEAVYHDLISSHHHDHKTLGNLAAIRGMQGRIDEMITLLESALNLEPSYPEALNNLGNALRLTGKPDAAIETLNKALALRPDFADAHHNLGVALQERGNLNAALSSYNRAIELKPDYAEALWNSALIMLAMGNYDQGWERYEWRTKRGQPAATPQGLRQDHRWDGDPSKAKPTQLLLIAEQGLGDTIQFMRYAKTLQKRGTEISICAQAKLHTLIQESGIDPSPITPEEADQAYKGRWTHLLSIPRYLRVTPTNPVTSTPYIKTSTALIEKWSRALQTEKRPIIGINWQGNPETEREGLQGRSLDLKAFAPVAFSNQISLLSLQKGWGSEQLHSCSFRDRFVTCQGQIDENWDLLEAAAIITNCDLVITSDTVVAHLSGGMGKTTWLLLHHMPDWRWGLEREDSFWYPSMRLFRQRERGCWDQVMQKVAEAIPIHFGIGAKEH